MTALANQIRDLLTARVRAGEPGVAVGVYRDGVLTEQVCAGLAAVEHGAPVTPDTMFDIASASKQVTAAYYGEGPAHTYYQGCSNGGRGALNAAAKYGADFDGVFRQVVRNRIEWSLREGKGLYPETIALWNSVR